MVVKRWNSGFSRRTDGQRLLAPPWAWRTGKRCSQVGRWVERRVIATHNTRAMAASSSEELGMPLLTDRQRGHRVSCRRRPLLKAPAGADAGTDAAVNAALAGRCGFSPLGPVSAADPTFEHPRRGQLVDVTGEFNKPRERSGLVRSGAAGSWRRLSVIDRSR